MKKNEIFIKSKTLERFMEIVSFETLIKFNDVKHLHKKSIKDFEEYVINDLKKEIENFLTNSKIKIKTEKNEYKDEDLIEKQIPKSIQKNLKLKNTIKHFETKKLEKKNSLKILIKKIIDDKMQKEKENPSLSSKLANKYGFDMNFKKKSTVEQFVKLIPEIKVIEKLKEKNIDENYKEMLLDVNQLRLNVENQQSVKKSNYYNLNKI